MNSFGKIWFGVCLVGFATGVFAQTITTTGGAANTVPLFSGSTTLVNSVITQSGSNVGIGTTTPVAPLHTVGGGNIIPSLTYGSPAGFIFNTAGQDLAGGVGDSPYATWLQVRNWANNAMPLSLNPLGGNVGIGTTSPAAVLHAVSVAGNIMPSLIYGSQAGFIFNNAAQELAGGTGNSPYAYWLQVRNWANNAMPLSLNPLGGNVGIGTTNPGSTYKLDVAGNVHTSGSVIFGDGSTQSTAWTGSLCGGDYAESIDVSDDRKKYEPGDVLVIDPNDPGKFLKSAEPYSTAVTGIFSTKPGVVGRRQTVEKSPNEIPMAMIGIVPAKVSAENGPVKPGDLLVTSSTFGYAMKGTDRSRMLGAVIGKALGSLESGTGVIEVVLTLQ